MQMANIQQNRQAMGQQQQRPPVVMSSGPVPAGQGPAQQQPGKSHSFSIAVFVPQCCMWTIIAPPPPLA